MWLSLVERTVRDGEVACSNHVAPIDTIFILVGNESSRYTCICLRIIVCKTWKGQNIFMRPKNLHTSGEFARMAQISLRTVRYYDKQNILKPSYVSESGARFYSGSDFVRLQQILLLKYLGFSLDEIKEMTIDDSDRNMMRSSMDMQLKLVRDRIEQLQMVEQAIVDTSKVLESNQTIDWQQLLDIIHLTNMENSMSRQYKDATNINARIHLHKLYSINQESWFSWIYNQCEIKGHMNILEVGCGNGAMWIENKKRIPSNINIVLSDCSEGMLRDARREIGLEDTRFHYVANSCENLEEMGDHVFDLVIANHMLFYCDDIDKALAEIARVLKVGGRLIASTYGAKHMREISMLVKEFDDRIVLAANKLYEHFGLNNGEEILQCFFEKIEKKMYDDGLCVTKANPLIEYIMSCHGNQNQYILNRYKEFKQFVEKKVKKGFFITKDAGIFLCTKKST